MLKIPKETNREIKMASLGSLGTMSCEKLPAKNIISKTEMSVITDPIDPKRISKESANCLTMSSALKAVLVFAGTIGFYNLFKNTKIFSYLGWKAKNSNMKDVDNNKIMKVKNEANALSEKINLKTTRSVNSPSVDRIVQTYKPEDKSVIFDEMKIEEFKNSPNVKEEMIERRSFDRRSIVPQNSIPTLAFKGSCYIRGFAEEVAVSGNYAYVTNVLSKLMIVDVKDPSNPTVKSSYDMPDEAYGLAISGNYLYAAADCGGLQIIDISNPLNPTFKGSYDMPDEAYGLAISGNYAYVACSWDTSVSSLWIIDISNPANPKFKGSCYIPDLPGGVAVSSNYAYVACGVYESGSLQIIDISDPARPKFKGSYNTPDVAEGITVSGNYAYVACLGSGLQIIDISDPVNPTFKGSYGTYQMSAEEVVLSGNYAYVAGGGGGLLMIDVSDPANPTLGASARLKVAMGVAISGNYAYAAVTNLPDDSSLQIFYTSSTNTNIGLTVTLIIIGSITVTTICLSTVCCAVASGIIVLRRCSNKDKIKEKKNENSDSKTLTKPFLNDEK